MKNYFIKKTDVEKLGVGFIEKIQSMENDKIFQFTIGSYDGWLIESSVVDEVLKVLSCKKEKETKTEFEGIFIIHFKKIVVDTTSRDAYVAACQRRVKVDLSDAKERLRSLTNELKDIRQQLVEKYRERNLLELRLQELNRIYDDRIEKYNQEYDRILENEKIKTVNVSSRTIEIYTETLFVFDEKSGKKFEIGKFQINIPMDGGGDVVWKNQTRFVDGFNAPNVNEMGLATTGDVYEVLPEILAHYEFAAAADIVINYIENVDVDSVREKLEKWPVVVTK